MEGRCHFKLMEYECGDSDDNGDFEEWLICKTCGHTESVPTARTVKSPHKTGKITRAAARKAVKAVIEKRDLVQIRNPKTDRYVKVDKSKGVILGSKKTAGPYKNIPIVPPILRKLMDEKLQIIFEDEK